MAHTDTFVRASIPIHKRAAIVLHWLATGNTLHSVGKMFGVHRSTVNNFVIIISEHPP